MSAPTVEKRTGPSMRRGSSKQDYATPRAFIEAVEKRFGPLSFDLAAHRSNSVTGACYFGPDHPNEDYRDSLVRPWVMPGNLWLNPPFADIEPWAEKCEGARHRTGLILLLTPASVGSAWYERHVHHKAFVMPLSPRLAFNGEPYPKDLILSAFGFGMSGFEPWRWR